MRDDNFYDADLLSLAFITVGILFLVTGSAHSKPAFVFLVTIHCLLCFAAAGPLETGLQIVSLFRTVNGFY